MGRLSSVIANMVSQYENKCPYCGAKIISELPMHLPVRCEKNPAIIREKEIAALPEHLKKYIK